jgi:hypothetical protein
MNILTTITPDSVAEVLFNVSGKDLCNARRVCVLMRTIIDARESSLYRECEKREFPIIYSQYLSAWPYRTDWKNIYVISTQCIYATLRSFELRKTIHSRQAFERIEIVLNLVETAMSLCTVTLNIVKISHFGWAASRAAIREFIKANPHMTLREVYEALGIVSKNAAPLLT